MVERNLQRVVDVVKSRQPGVEVRITQVRPDRIHIERRIRDTSGHGGLVEVFLAKQVPAQRADVRDLENCRGQELPLHREVVVGIRGNFEGRSTRCRQSIGSERDTGCAAEWVIERSIGFGRCLYQRRIAEGILFPDSVQCAVEEDAEASTNRRHAPSIRVV